MEVGSESAHKPNCRRGFDLVEQRRRGLGFRAHKRSHVLDQFGELRALVPLERSSEQRPKVPDVLAKPNLGLRRSSRGPRFH
jgi:hypothetical protein